ncbi:EAL domain-containing protein, partial [Rhodoferax sp.]|uniref:sensor domain-containing protein n=1 Tax=Rhodoferax sp. TaxID=50421 RepID=UPI0026068BED
WLWHDGDESGLRAFGLKLKLPQVCTSSDSLETSKSLMDYLGSYRTMRQLGRHDRRARAIFEAIDDAVVVLDVAGKVTSLNARAEAMLGTTQARACGQRYMDVIKLADLHTGQTLASPVQQVLAEQKPVQALASSALVRPDGSQLVIEHSAAPLFDSRGQLFGVVLVFHDISIRHATQLQFEREHELFEKTFNLSAVGMAHISPAGKWTRVNQKLCDITGYPAQELMRLSFQGITHPDDVGTDMANIKRLLAREMVIYRSEKRYIRKDGQVVWVAINVRVVWKDDGTPDFGVSVIEDIHTRKLAEEEATIAHKQYEALFEQLPEGVLLIDTGMQIAAHNREAMHQLGYSSAQMPTLHVWDFEAQDDQATVEARKLKILQTGRDDFESVYRRADGTVFDVDISVQLMQLPDGVTVFQTLFRDISVQKETARQIAYMAYHDQLTGLANRRLLHDRLNQAISSAQRHQAHVAVLFLDLDHFKLVNDSLGHPVGDELLLQMALRLQACVRAEDTVARVGGDEFVLLLPNVATELAAAAMADKVIAALSKPMHIRGEELRVTPSIGISLCPQDGADTDTLLKQADAALYQAKKLGRATYRFFTKALNDDAQERLHMERHLRKALEREEFELYYQPQVNLHTGHLLRCEALIRWNHPTMGLVPPGRFIPIAEHSDLINQIGRWVMHQACSQAKVWQDQGHALKVSFNVSARQFLHPDELLANLTSALACGVLPQHMSVELTESLLLDAQSMGPVLQRMHDMGVQLSLDDFGTGYSSLSYLRRFPIDVLKIDQSFVSHSDQNPDDVEMVKTIIGMAHNMGMTLVAEGVETAAQGMLLADLQCEVAQGYFFSKPVPLAQFEALLQSPDDFRPSQFLASQYNTEAPLFYDI